MDKEKDGFRLGRAYWNGSKEWELSIVTYETPFWERSLLGVFKSVDGYVQLSILFLQIKISIS